MICVVWLHVPNFMLVPVQKTLSLSEQEYGPITHAGTKTLRNRILPSLCGCVGATMTRLRSERGSCLNAVITASSLGIPGKCSNQMSV